MNVIRNINQNARRELFTIRRESEAPMEHPENQLHIPVMVAESCEWLSLAPGARVIDATFGLGGHTSAFLQKIGANGRVLGLDRDPQALSLAREKFKNEPRVRIHAARFSQIAEAVEENLQFLGAPRVDAVFFDFGVSSLQLDDASRGFSFQRDGLLDLRMSQSEHTRTAADIVNSMPVEELANILYEYGEERASRRVARAIADARNRARITHTLQLAEIVKNAVPFSKADAGRIHPATRTFQALRIVVNGELDEIETGLAAALRLLAPGGRVVALSYHSMEDRIVKLQFREAASGSFNILTKKPVEPGDAEIAENPRSRSARLRAIERLASGAAKSRNKYSQFSNIHKNASGTEERG